MDTYLSLTQGLAYLGCDRFQQLFYFGHIPRTHAGGAGDLGSNVNCVSFRQS